MSAAVPVMTTRMSGHRRRTAVSLPVASSEPVEQLDNALDALHRVNRALPRAALGREELIALGGLLTQLSGALLTLADLLSVPAHRYERTRLLGADPDTPPAEQSPPASSSLQGCRDGFLAASTSAQSFHAGIRQCPPTRAHPSTGR